MRFRAPHLERRCWPHWRWCHSAATPPELTAAPSLTWCRGRNGCIRSSKASSCYTTGHVRFLEEPMLNASTVSHTRSLLSGCARKAKSWRRRSSRVLRLLLRRRVLLLPLLLQLLLWRRLPVGAIKAQWRLRRDFESCCTLTTQTDTCLVPLCHKSKQGKFGVCATSSAAQAVSLPTKAAVRDVTELPATSPSLNRSLSPSQTRN